MARQTQSVTATQTLVAGMTDGRWYRLQNTGDATIYFGSFADGSSPPDRTGFRVGPGGWFSAINGDNKLWIWTHGTSDSTIAFDEEEDE